MHIDLPGKVILDVDGYTREARATFHDYYAANKSTFESAEKAFRTLVSSVVKAEGIPVSKIVSRLKDKDECIRKFDRKYRQECEKSAKKYKIREHITDLIGVRVVCFYESDIELVKRAIEKHLNLIDKTDKRVFENPNEFGYQGLHLDVRLDEKRAQIVEYEDYQHLVFEVQIRTIVQDAWSEVDHKLQYKKEIPSHLKRKINALAALFEMADRDFMSVRDETDRLFKKIQKEDQKDTASEEPLNALSFLAIAQPLFPEFTFDHERNDVFVALIKEQDPDISRGKFKQAIVKNIELVRKFRNYLVHELNSRGVNPVTMIRYCLYLENRVLYEKLLYASNRKNIDRFAEFGTVRPSEIGKKKRVTS